MQPPAADLSRGPGRDCPLCPRLETFRHRYRSSNSDWHNAPVPAFAGTGDSPRVLIVGLAPGLRGANRTGRPFTGDFAGALLYPTLVKHGLAVGTYGNGDPDDLQLLGCRITNAVRCVPPENKPTGPEISACNPFLGAEIASLQHLRVILALGAIAHGAVLKALGWRRAAAPFSHGAVHGGAGVRTSTSETSTHPHPLVIVDSYHCSRLNTNTGRLTEVMFDEVIARVAHLSRL